MLSASDKQQVDRAVVLVHQILGSDALGAYLFGSAVLGGLRPESDLDILLVSKRATTHAEKEELVQGLMEISGRRTPQGTWRRIELTTVVHRDINPWRYPPIVDLQYGDWLRGEFAKGNLEPLPTPFKPDLALLITMAANANTPIFGPPPAEVFDAVPSRDLQRAMMNDLDRLRSDIDSDTRNVVLTLARMWSTLATGVIRSKDAAANWVLERLPARHRPVLARAREIYLNGGIERWDDLKDSIGPLVEYVVTQIRGLAATSPVEP
jgi:predicted nucleotidyltransferase